MLTNRLAVIAEVSLLIVIIALAGYLRLVNNADNPGWYTDETTHIDIAQNLLNGRVQYMAVQDSTLLFARPPLFHVMVAALLCIFPEVEAIVGLRSLTGLLGVGSVVLVYGLARPTDKFFALWAAFLLAIYPQAVVYSRLGFSYNLLAPLILVMLVGLARGWLMVASFALGLALVTDVMALSWVLPFGLVLVILGGRRRASPLQIAAGIGLILMPVTLYALVMLGRAPAAFGFDLHYTLTRLAPNATLTEQIDTLTTNFSVLFGRVDWMLFGVLGLFALPGRRWRGLALLMFGLPLVSVGRTVPLYSLSAYYLIPLLPFVPLGIAALLLRAWQLIGKLGLPVQFGKIIGVSVGVALALVPTVRNDLRAVEQGFTTSIDPFLIHPHDARAVAEYLNAHTQSDDVVIVSPPIGWLVNAQVADFQMAVAAEGQVTPHLPGDLPAERWAFDARFSGAPLVVVDPLWTHWGVVHVPTLDARLREIEGWSLVFEAGEIRVYQNPAVAPK